MDDPGVENTCLLFEKVPVVIHVLIHDIVIQQFSDEIWSVNIGRDPADQAIVFEGSLKLDLVVPDELELGDTDEQDVLTFLFNYDFLTV